MRLNDLLSANYNELLKAAYKITGSKIEAQDILTETYLELHDKQIKVSDNDFIRFFCGSMRNSKRWVNSNYNKIRSKEFLTDIDQNQTIEDEQIHVDIEPFKQSIPTHESILFELYYEQNKSCQQISNELKETGYEIHYKSIQKLIKPIKIKLKAWKQSNF